MQISTTSNAIVLSSRSQDAVPSMTIPDVLSSGKLLGSALFTEVLLCTLWLFDSVIVCAAASADGVDEYSSIVTSSVVVCSIRPIGDEADKGSAASIQMSGISLNKLKDLPAGSSLLVIAGSCRSSAKGCTRASSTVGAAFAAEIIASS